jgi:hypothetical protein
MIIRENANWKSNNYDTIQPVVPSEWPFQEIPAKTYNNHYKSK